VPRLRRRLLCCSQCTRAPHVGSPTRCTTLEVIAIHGLVQIQWDRNLSSIQLGASPTVERNTDQDRTYCTCCRTVAVSTSQPPQRRLQRAVPSTDPPSRMCRAWPGSRRHQSDLPCTPHTMSHRIQRTYLLHNLCRAWRHSHPRPMCLQSKSRTTRSPARCTDPTGTAGMRLSLPHQPSARSDQQHSWRSHRCALPLHRSQPGTARTVSPDWNLCLQFR
jgi:hypothetical protein